MLGGLVTQNLAYRHPKQLGPLASFQSLPLEITTLIASHCDKRTALDLARVSRACASSAEGRLVRDIRVKITPQYGVLPLVQPYLEEHGDHYVAWAREDARRVEEECAKAIKERIKIIMAKLEKRRAGMVQEIAVLSVPGALADTVKLLGLVSANLRHLTIEAPYIFGYQCGIGPTPLRTLDFHISSSALSFPSLTYLRLGQDACQFAETTLLLLTRAPNLVELSGDIDHDLWPFPRDTPTQAFLLDQPTHGRLRRAEVACNGRRLAWTRGRDEVRDRITHPVHEVLIRNPSLRQLSIKTRDCRMSWSNLRKLLRIVGSSEVQDFHLAASPDDFDHSSPDDVSWSSLKRLVLRSDYSLPDVLASQLSLPSLEVLVYLTLSRTPKAHRSTETLPVQRLSPSFAAHIKLCPNLRVILTSHHSTSTEGLRVFDTLDRRRTKSTGFVHSYCNGGSELLHARLLSEWTQCSNATAQYRLRSPPEDLYYYKANGRGGGETFQKQAAAVWQDFTDLDGVRVPLGVIEDMRIAEGASVKQWKRRGVQVSDAAWKVLTDWRDAHRSELKELEVTEDAEGTCLENSEDMGLEYS